MKKRVSLLLLPLMATSALAEDTPEEEQVEVRRYTVELIVFSYAQDVSTGTEIFLADEPPVEEFLAGDLLIDDVPSDDFLSVELPVDDFQEETVALSDQDFSLDEIYERMEKLEIYEPLLHFGWTQPTYPKEDTEARPLSSFVTPPAGLQGDLTLYLSRYLHLVVNLQLDAPHSIPPPSDETVVTYPVRYRIDEDRIFRNGDLRYYDHPKFGVLAKITRVEEEEPEEEFLGETGLAGFDGQ